MRAKPIFDIGSRLIHNYYSVNIQVKKLNTITASQTNTFYVLYSTVLAESHRC